MILYGASGHGKVVKSASTTRVKLYFDDNPILNWWEGLQVIRYDADYMSDELVVISIGNNQIRKNLVNEIKHRFAVVQSASAEVDSSCIIGNGSQILHGSLIQPSVVIGDHVIINSKASVDHDCKIGNFCHVAPNATLCGDITLGEGVLIGAGAVVIPGITIGDWACIGAGSVVTKNVISNETVFGNPATTRKK